MYDSGSDVRQHSYIDKDQRDMEKYLGAPIDYGKAKNIYEKGGNSGGYAEITLTTGLTAAHAKGVVVTQAGTSTKTGTLKSAAAAGATMIKVSYPTSDPPACKDGGYTANADTTLPAITTGCFTAGAITVGTNVGTASNVVNKYRTLQGFSTQAEAKMKMQETFQVYRAYYGEYDYANQYVLDALGYSGTGTGAAATGAFIGLGDDARTQGVKKGTAYMNVWMYVTHEIEDAIMDCQNSCTNPNTQTCNQDPVHAIDEAAAFYAGSLEGATATGDADKGKLVFRLAQKRCGDFGTCLSSGQAKANHEIIQKLSEAQAKLRQANCVEVVEIKKRIVELMSIPLIQGSIRYAYKVGEDSGGLKEKAEGAVFSAAILPRVHACDAAKAKIISDNMKINAQTFMTSGFKAVKEAFEATYCCLGITCADIGGLLKSSTVLNDYADCSANSGGANCAAPCTTTCPGTGGGGPVSSALAMRRLSLLVSWCFLCSGFFQF
jgi:Notch-like protein